MSDDKLTMAREIKPGMRVGLRYAQEPRADGTEHIPAAKAMRGTVLSVRGEALTVKWDCDCSPSNSQVDWVIEMEEA